MQEFSQADQNGTQEDIEKFETLLKQNKEAYFDIHQIESIFDYYYEKSLLEKAEQALTLGLRIHPNASSLLLKQSTIYIEQGAHPESLQILNYLKELEIENSEVFLNLGIIYIREKDRTRAIKYFEKALKFVAHEDHEDYIFEISFNLNQQGYFNESKNMLNHFSYKVRKNENLLFELGFAYDKLIEIEKGIETYSQLLDINPYSENAWYNLGILYNKQELFEKAIHAYDMTLAISPELIEAQYNKANSLAQIGNYVQALDCYVEYASRTYPSGLTYFYMGDCWENIGNLAYANRYYKLASDLDPENLEALESLGRTAYKNKDYSTSIEAFDKALDITPDSSELWLSLGKSHKKAKNITEAKRCLKKALINKSEDTLSWLEMYQFLEENEVNFEPLTFIDSLLNKDHTNGAIHYLAAVIFNKHKDHKQSLTHLVIARQLLPNDLNVVLDEYPQLVSMPKIAEYINSNQ